MFRTNRGLLKFLLLSLITFGIYGIVVMTHISMEIDTIASPRDHKNTMNYLLVCFLLGPVTLGIYTLIWNHQLSNRIGDELKARNLGYEFGTKTAEDFVSLRGNTLVIAAFADMRMHPDNVMKAVIGKP